MNSLAVFWLVLIITLCVLAVLGDFFLMPWALASLINRIYLPDKFHVPDEK
ncbi:hypothetical protein [Alicyclobacillus tolerans]|uniref:hypothetical protein n=1 Tax=Alicyclobacillus tolerans TaxID=90970 RepID=UPI001A963FD9|nr:hypothetical protein [Alicyclobacillus montanus]